MSAVEINLDPAVEEFDRIYLLVSSDLKEKEMDGCCCFCWNREDVYEHISSEPEPFSLPAAFPKWPEGKDFAKGKISLGELEIVNITKFQSIWSFRVSHDGRKGAIFYKPVEIPDGFFALGDYGQPIDRPFRGFVLAARAAANSKGPGFPPLQKPIDYTLIWSLEDSFNEPGFFWLPCPPDGYRAAGYVVTNDPNKPSVDAIRCIRTDLTEVCESHEPILSTDVPFSVWKCRPSFRGMWCKGVPLGTFCCRTDSSNKIAAVETDISCFKNLDQSLLGMPNLDQVHAIIKHYGPTIFFHPKEAYLPSSVPWFFTNGAALHSSGDEGGRIIDADGSNLPSGGINDGEYWIDLPDDRRGNRVKHGNIDSAEVYVHVKPALGGTFTDIVMWVFCPFNGPVTLKIGMLTLSLKKLGQHVGDWEHFTLRVSNFTGELWCVYFSEHSGGRWVDVSGLEFLEGNKVAVYSSRSGHASFPHSGSYFQGSEKLGIGLRNDAAQSELYVDSSVCYRIVAAEYLGDAIPEPCWLQYMREWGPTVEYGSRSELHKILAFLPVNIRYSVENVLDQLPVELFGEEGPTGPKQKDNWLGDERFEMEDEQSKSFVNPRLLFKLI